MSKSLEALIRERITQLEEADLLRYWDDARIAEALLVEVKRGIFPSYYRPLDEFVKMMLPLVAEAVGASRRSVRKERCSAVYSALKQAEPVTYRRRGELVP